MSRAFVKEDVDVPERSTRRRAATGLPPGALNYMTAAGAEELRSRLAALRRNGADQDEIQRLEESLQSATVVHPPENPDVAVFGTAITLQNSSGQRKTCRIVGVDEVPLSGENTSWTSPIGKALLGTALNQRLKLPPDDLTWWTVMEIR